MTRAIAKSKTTVTDVANVFLDYWILLHCIPDHILGGECLSLKADWFLPYAVSTLEISTENNVSGPMLRAIIQISKSNGIALLGYAVVRQRDYDLHNQPHTKAKNIQVHQSTPASPIRWVPYGSSRDPQNLIFRRQFHQTSTEMFLPAYCNIDYWKTGFHKRKCRQRFNGGTEGLEIWQRQMRTGDLELKQNKVVLVHRPSFEFRARRSRSSTCQRTAIRCQNHTDHPNSLLWTTVRGPSMKVKS